MWKPWLRQIPGGYNVLGCPHLSEWLEIPDRPCSARETEETCTLNAPTKVVMEHPLPVFLDPELET